MSTVHAEWPGDNAPVRRTPIERVTAALRSNNIDVRVVDTGEEARRLALELVPEGTEVHSGKSKTLEDLGLYRELFESGRYDSVRARSLRMDRKTQGRAIRKLTAAPDYMLGSVHAVTEGGDLVVASASASQLGPYASGAGRLILVVGSQKIVADLEEALRRIDEHANERSHVQMRFITLRVAADAEHPAVKRMVRKAFKLGGTAMRGVKS